MMVAFGISSPPAILDLDGPGLRGEFDRDPAFFVESLEDQFSNLGLQGIHVWEGEPDITIDEHDDADFGGCDLRAGAWRAPTDAEWVALRARRLPFNSPADVLDSLVE